MTPETSKGEMSRGVVGARLQVRSLSHTLGAEIVGIDLGGTDIAPVLDAIKAAFRQYHFLVFRDQDLTDAQLHSLAQNFGEVEKHVSRQADGTPHSPVHGITNLDATGKPSLNPYTNANYYWHTDKSHYVAPALLTMLYAVEIPPEGGDTEFADMTKAYAALPVERRQELEALRVEHSYEFMRRKLTTRPVLEAERRDAPPVVHPLVRTHPETGRKSLYIGMYCSRIVGMSDADGQQLLQILLDHATQSDFVFTHHWQPHDLVMWDNRCLLHRAIANYDMEKYRRTLRRVVVKGTVPY